jgi:nitrite reductase (NADH) large subunit
VARAAAISVNRGVVVNDRMETSAPDVYAAGDVAEHGGICYGLIVPAREQAACAGRNMAGETCEYHGTPLEARTTIAGIPLLSAGDFASAEGTVRVSQSSSSYRKIIVQDDRLVGAIVLGDTKAASTVSAVLKGTAPVSSLPEFSG